MQKRMRRERELLRESSAVAETFKRLRMAEEEEFRQHELRILHMNEGTKYALDAIAAADAAVADLLNTKRDIQDIESTRACNMAVNILTLDVVAAGCPKFGGARSKHNRLEVLERLARHKAGLSRAQRNDCQ